MQINNIDRRLLEEKKSVKLKKKKPKIKPFTLSHKKKKER